MIVKRLVVGGWRANCYIVGSETSKQGLIIDPGDEAEDILRAVKLSGLEIKVLAATHGHIDHIGAMGRIKKATNAQVVIHEEDATALQGDGRFFWGMAYGPPLYPDRTVREGDTIDVTDLHFNVINTPGHTYGGICLYGHGALFTGDTLFRRSIGSSGIGTGTYSQLINSIVKKLMVLPKDTIVYPGHGSQTTIGDELKTNHHIRVE